VRNGTIEGIEMKVPVLIEERALRPDSGGAGKFRGGFGMSVRATNIIEGRWNLRSGMRKNCPPWGLWGGRAGAYGAYYIKKPGETEFREIDVSRYLVPAETEVLLLTSGGGGWGDPLEREPAKVRWDVIEEVVTPEAARADYGVVLTGDDFAVDEAATRALRDSMRAGRADDPETKIVIHPGIAAE